jgi:hypothetical protein
MVAIFGGSWADAMKPLWFLNEIIAIIQFVVPDTMPLYSGGTGYPQISSNVPIFQTLGVHPY